MFNPVVTPLLISPIEINPVRGGARVTTAPGIATKVLSGVVDWNNWAVTVTVEVSRLSPALILK